MQFNEDDLDAFCGALAPKLEARLMESLVPKIEERLAERFFAKAGRGMLDTAWKAARPILVVFFIYGLLASTKIGSSETILQKIIDLFK